MSEPGFEKTARLDRESGLYEELKYAIARWGADAVQRVLDSIVTHPPSRTVTTITVPELPAGHWFCARCGSVLPDGYWHHCTPEGRTSGGPTKAAESSTGAKGGHEEVKDTRKWND